MKNILCIALFLLSIHHIKAQNNIDSLRNIWNDKLAHDTIRLDALSQLVQQNQIFSDFDTTIYFAQLQYNFAEAKGLKSYMGQALNTLGWNYLMKGDYIKSLEFHQKSLKIRTDINDSLGIISSLNGLGVIYNALGNYHKALEYYTQVMEKAEQLEYPIAIAGTSINMSNCYLKLGDYDNALSYVERGIELSDEIGEIQFLANGLEDRGKIYLENGNFEQSRLDFERALKTYNDMNDPSGQAIIFGNLGILFNRINKPSESIYYCNRSLKMAVDLGAKMTQEIACQCLYDAYKALANDKKALEFHEKLLQIRDDLKKEDANQQMQLMEFEKKELQAKQEHLQEVHKKNQTRNFLAGAGILVMLLAGGIYSRLQYVHKSKTIIESERDRSENLLLNILPAEIAAELKEHGEAAARDFDQVSILFTDFQAFTQLSEKLGAKELVAEMNYCFKAFDEICEKYNIEKIKTIGDSYMAAGGLPVPSEDSPLNTVLAGIEMAQFIVDRKAEREAAGNIGFEMRTGVHTGNVVAGIIGVKKFQYDIWGDTVNTASRMESNGEVGKVNISQHTYEIIKDNPALSFEHRGKISAKGKGEVDMWFVGRA